MNTSDKILNVFMGFLYVVWQIIKWPFKMAKKVLFEAASDFRLRLAKFIGFLLFVAFIGYLASLLK